MKQRAIIAMSGGVDSSVAALLMQRAGYDCIGATMKLYANEDVGLQKGHPCCSLEDVEDARSVAFRLNMPYYVMNFAEDFREKVMIPFAKSYLQGRTPNPCIECNRCLKFDRLMRRARELEADWVATGHYARVEQDGGRYLIKKAVDAGKDQSYVLYMLTQEQLAHLKLPLGGLNKAEVREIAAENGFVNARKHDSQDICFVPDGNYGAFIQRFAGEAAPPGDFVDGMGRVLGRHRGIIHYTIGQRKGLGIALGRPAYVQAIDPKANTVTLSDDAALYRRELDVEHVNLIALDRIDRPMRLTVRIRYSQKESPAEVVQTEEGRLHIRFETPQRAVAPGQAAVIYDGETVVGGGTIS